MSQEKHFKYPLLLPEEWYRNLESQGLGKARGNEFVFNHFIGKGKLQFLEFQEGFWVQQMDFTLDVPLRLEQLPGDSNTLFIINFYLNNAHIKQKIGDKVFDFQLDNVSIMLSSSVAQSNYNIPAGESIKIFQIGFSRDWLLPNAFGSKNPDLRTVFETDHPIYLSENLNFKFKYLVEGLDINNSNHLYLFSTSLQLLNTFFSHLEDRNVINSLNPKIHHADIEHLLKVKTYLDTNPLEEAKLEELSEMAHMSLSKFKRLFKLLFGTTPYNYRLKSKLTIALELIQSKNYMVSEAGNLIGYHNLSQFSKAFRKQFGILPSEVRKD